MVKCRLPVSQNRFDVAHRKAFEVTCFHRDVKPLKCLNIICISVKRKTFDESKVGFYMDEQRECFFL